MTAPEAGDLAAVRALANAATPGPWEVPGANVFRVVAPSATHTNRRQGLSPPYPWLVVADMGDPDGNARDARFIAQSRTLVPALCDEVERLRRLCETHGVDPEGCDECFVASAEGREAHGEPPRSAREAP